MKRLEPEIIDYYNNEVIMMIAEKYGFSQMEALKAFVNSKPMKCWKMKNAICWNIMLPIKTKKRVMSSKNGRNMGLQKKYTITIGYIIPSASKMPIWISTA